MRPYLKRRNAREVTIALTHGHLDHTGGAEGLLRRFDVARLVLAAADSTAPWTEPLRRAAYEEEVEVVWLARGDDLRVGPQVLRCLWPPGDPPFEDANERSLVLVTEPGRELFLTGDLEWGGEERLAVGAPVTVLKVAHHGGDTGTGDALLARLRPGWALISCGRGNRYGHPAPETLGRLSKTEAVILRTDQRGAIEFSCDRSRVEVRTARRPP